MKAWIIDKLKKLGGFALAILERYKAQLISYGLGAVTVFVLWIIAAVRG
jgi:hypothetical protein